MQIDPLISTSTAALCRDALEIRIGPFIYEARVATEPLETGGAISELDRAIWICPEVPARERLHILTHEAAHAYEWAYGKPPADAECRMNWMATFAADLIRQIAEQGGEFTLMSLGQRPL